MLAFDYIDQPLSLVWYRVLDNKFPPFPRALVVSHRSILDFPFALIWGEQKSGYLGIFFTDAGESRSTSTTVK